MGLVSLYHESFHEDYGHEIPATLYLQRNPNKPYHVDYTFQKKELLPSAFLKLLKEKSFIESSDHTSLLVDLDLRDIIKE